MRCDERNLWLDRLMDDELSAEERQELRRHGQECPNCAQEIQSAFQLKAIMGEMTSEADVPLPAQAAWRSAVRAEASHKNRRRFYRLASAAAAVVVVALGVGLGFNTRNMPSPKAMDAASVNASEVAVEEAVQDAPLMAAMPMATNMPLPTQLPAYEDAADNGVYVDAESAMVQADGLSAFSAAMDAEYAEESAPMHDITLHVSSADEACATARDLIAEYEGQADVQAVEGGANLYITLPGENLDDFISAIAFLDVDGQALQPFGEGGAGSVSLLLSIRE